MKRAALLSLAALAALTALMTGCGGDAPAGEAPMFPVEPTLTVTSATGRLKIDVWTAPSPPVKGVNALRLAFSDGGGGSVDAAEVSATAWMPAHGHGTSVKTTFTDAGGGVYEAPRIVFFMDGHWEIRGELKESPGATDAFTESFVDSFVAAFDVL